MMRFLVVVLLLANLGYAAWHFMMAREQAPSAVVRSPVASAPRTLELIGDSAGEQAPACVGIGPFSDAAAGNAFLEAAEEAGYRGGLLPRQVPDNPHYWVLVPPDPATGGNELVQMLSEAGLDSYLIRGGELDQGVSLGIFTDRGEAQDRASRLAEMSLEAELREIPRTRTALFVELRASPDALRSEPLLSPQLSAESAPELSEKLCETIAPRF